MTDIISPETAVNAANAINSAANTLGTTATKVGAASETAASVVKDAWQAVPPGLLDKLGNGMFLMFEKASEVLANYGPDVGHMALMYVRVQGAVELAKGLACLIAIWFLVKQIPRIWISKLDPKDKSIVLSKSLVERWRSGIENKREYGGSAPLGCGVITIAIVLGTIILSTISFSKLNPWNFVKVIAPSIGLVHEVYTGAIEPRIMKKK